jgi:hypothetical protein
MVLRRFTASPSLLATHEGGYHEQSRSCSPRPRCGTAVSGGITERASCQAALFNVQRVDEVVDRAAVAHQGLGSALRHDRGTTRVKSMRSDLPLRLATDSPCASRVKGAIQPLPLATSKSFRVSVMLCQVGTRCSQRPRQTSAPAARKTSRTRYSRPRQRRSAQAPARWPIDCSTSARSPAWQRLNAGWASVRRSLVRRSRPARASAGAAWPCPETLGPLRWRRRQRPTPRPTPPA